MIDNARHFRAESEALYALLIDKTDRQLNEISAFKQWSFNDIIRHLHIWNKLACLSLEDGEALKETLEKHFPDLDKIEDVRAVEAAYFSERSGADLLSAWRAYSLQTATLFEEADPGQRLLWAGSEVSAQSRIIGRFMETWAHAQAIYDALGEHRENTDSIRSIAELGVRTYRWSFVNRELEVPVPKPYVRLTAPSGRIWQWNGERDEERIIGAAEEFCQVVTQTRNIADTSLEVVGSNANKWMSIAQCFAGMAKQPPAAGTRQKK